MNLEISNNNNNNNISPNNNINNNNNENELKYEVDLTNKKVGWEFNDEAEEILGAKITLLNSKDQLVFLVKWFV